MLAAIPAVEYICIIFAKSYAFSCQDYLRARIKVDGMNNSEP